MIRLHVVGYESLISGMTPNMDDRKNAVTAPRDQLRGQQPQSDLSAATIVILFNAVVAGLGGLYVSTRSIAVTALAAVSVAVLALLVGRRRVP